MFPEVTEMRARRIKIILLAVVLAILGACLWGLYHTGFFQAAGSEADLEAYIQGFAPGHTWPTLESSWLPLS